MNNVETDTIVALATPSGRGGVGVVRISGPETQKIAKKILKKIPKPRFASFSTFKDTDDTIIDEGIALLFLAPNSFTGEDILELQGHGGPIIMDRLINCILTMGGRLAQPGEFSLRAFLNGKMDLTQAEAIADLIDAQSQQAAQSAIRSLQGEFSNLIRDLVDSLIRLRMYIEASIDFPEEEIDFISESHVLEDLKHLIQKLEIIEKSAQQGSLLQEGMKVVIAGKPNAGKSSLLNSLSGKDSAIVTEIPGTTRDILREYIHIDGLPLHIVDTAGLRETQDIIEQEGMKRAWNEIENADVILWVIDANDFRHQKDIISNLTIKNKKITELKIPIVLVNNKIDLFNEKPRFEKQTDYTLIHLSAKYHQGIDFLKHHLKELIGYQVSTEGTFIARRRHLDALEQAKNYLITGYNQIQKHRAAELLAEDLRQAQQALSEITGEFTSDDLLGKIFSTFCIGK